MLAFAAQRGAEQMARKFIAGSNVGEAVDAVRAMRDRRLAFTIDLLGEATITEAEADHVQKQYLDLLARADARGERAGRRSRRSTATTAARSRA